MIRLAIVPAWLLLCLVLGGASNAGFLANLLLQLGALPLIGWALWRLLQPGAPLTPPIRVLLGMLAGLVVLGVLQFVPLPPGLWTHLPGRGPVAAGYQLLGIPLPWLPLTLAPKSALASLLWLLPAVAALLATVVLGTFRGRWIAGVILGMTLAGIVVGALQVIGGDSAYFYEVTNYGVAVGFFANANHNATLMLVCIPYLAALQASLVARARSPRSASAIRLLVLAAYAVIIVGLILNQSLAGIGLCVPVSLLSWLAFGRQRPAVRRALVVVTVLASVAALVAIVVGPFGNNLIGHQTKNVESSRQTSFALTLRAAAHYLPVGSGTGSFVPVYHTVEPLELVTGTYMNHAHSDWLELLLETGLAGYALIAAFLVWWAGRLRAIWRAEEPDVFAKAAAIATAAVMLHSIVDYPLRTAAIEAAFAVSLGLMAGARPFVRRSRQPSTTRHLTL